MKLLGAGVELSEHSGWRLLVHHFNVRFDRVEPRELTVELLDFLFLLAKCVLTSQFNTNLNAFDNTCRRSCALAMYTPFCVFDSVEMPPVSAPASSDSQTQRRSAP